MDNGLKITPTDTKGQVACDVIEQDGEELDLSGALEIAMLHFGTMGDVSYRFLFAMTKNERKAFRFIVSGSQIM